MVFIDDRNMVIEDNSGEWNPGKKEVQIIKKDTVHYERYAAIKQELQEKAEADKLGVPSDENISKFLLNDIPLPSKSKVETLTDAQIESMVPSTEQILEQMLKGKTSEQKKPNLDADGLPSEDDIKKALGIKEVI